MGNYNIGNYGNVGIHLPLSDYTQLILYKGGNNIPHLTNVTKNG